MSFNRHDLNRNAYMLTGSFRRRGYDWWWHSFTAVREDTGEERPFFIEFYLCNPALGGDEPVFGQLPENQRRHKRPSYLMVKAGWWGKDHAQLHRFFGWNQVRVKRKAPFAVEAEDCYCSDTVLRGSVRVSKEDAAAHPEWMCDAGEMTWDLKLDEQVAFNVGYGTSTLFRFLKAFEMYWHAEGIRTAYCGTITANGVRYLVRPGTSFGYSDKNWGSDFTSPWVWLSSNCIRSRISGRVLADSVFDIGGGRPKAFGIAMDRKLLGVFWHEGHPYEFNFSKFWTGTRTRFDFREDETRVYWHVRQENLRHVMDTKVSCRKEDMLLINYEAPDGQKRHNRLWNGGDGIGRIRLYRKVLGGKKLIDDMDATHIGCEYGEYDR